VKILKHVTTTAVLLGTLLSQPAWAVLINSPADLTGTEGVNVSFSNISIGVGYIRRWTTRECKKKFGIFKSCKTRHHSANEIQSGATRYTWDFGDGNTVAGVVSTSGGYFADGSDNLLVNLPVHHHTYLTSDMYTATLTVNSISNNADRPDAEDSVTTTVMVRPSAILSSNTEVCDINNATVISSRSRGLWNNASSWNTRTVPTATDIVFIHNGHTMALPRGKNNIAVAGLCIDQGAKLITRKNTVLTTNHVVMTASAIHNRGTISTEDGITGNTYEQHATNGGSITFFAGKFNNEGQLAAQGRGGDDIPVFTQFETGAGQLDAWGGDGGHIGVFPNEFINTGSFSAGNGGDAILFRDWSNYVYGNAYGGRGGSVHISARNMGLSRLDTKIEAGCGGLAEAIGSWQKTIKGKGGNFFSSVSFTGVYTGKLFDVKGGTGGNVGVNLSFLNGILEGCEGRTVNHVEVLPTEYIRFDPTILQVDETTRLTNAQQVYIYAGEDAEVDLRKLAPNAVQAYKTVTLSVGANSIIDLRGVNGTVFQAAEKVEVYADTLLLDDGVDFEDLADAPEVSLNPSKTLYFVDLDYQSQTKGTPGSILPVPVRILNNGPTEDTYTIAVTDSQNWLLPPFPAEIKVGGLRRAELFINLQLPDSGIDQTELLVTVTSQADSSVQQQALIRAMVQYPEKVTPRDGTPAEVAIVVDASYRIESRLHDIADSVMAFLDTNAKLSPSTEKVEAWFDQFDEDNPPSKGAYREFIASFQPQNPPPLPMVELITFTDTAVQTRVVTDDIADVVGRMRALQTAEADTCDALTVEAIQHAISNLKEEGHLFLAAASTPNQALDSVIDQLKAKRIKVHVFLVENCDGSAESALAYENLSGETGGVFRIKTDDKASDLAVLDELLDAILSMGKYTVMGTIYNEAGEALSGVNIEINGKTTTTDAAGNWEIPDFMEGNYLLQASKAGYVFAPQVVEVGNELYDFIVEIDPLSSLELIALPHTFEDLRQGEELTYTFTIVNGGVQTATGVTLTDVLPTGTTAISFQALYGGTCDLATLTCQLPDLIPGGSTVVELTLHNDQPNALKNVATLTANEYPADIKTSFKKVKPHLSVGVTDTPDPVVMQSALHYQVAVELSPLAPETTATGVELYLKLPTGAELASIDTEHGNCDISEYPTVMCQLDDLSIVNPNDISRATVDINLNLTDATLLVLTHEARVAAANYAAHFVRERTNVVVPPEAVADTIILMDTTHSMSEELNGVITATQQFIQQQMNSGQVVSVIEFKDNVTLRAFTSDMSQVLETLQQFEAEAGGTCQEASAEALDLAVKHTRYGGNILLISDAAPYADAELESITQRLRSKRINLSVMVSGDCATSTGQNTWQ